MTDIKVIDGFTLSDEVDSDGDISLECDDGETTPIYIGRKSAINIIKVFKKAFGDDVAL